MAAGLMVLREFVLELSFIPECESWALLKLSHKKVQVHGAIGFTSSTAFLQSATSFCCLGTMERDCQDDVSH